MAGKRYSNNGGKRFRDEPPKRKGKKKLAIVLVSLLAACTLAATGTTIAYLTTATGPVINTFSPTDTVIEIPEEIQGNIKQSASVQNNGDIDVYVRAQIVVTWKADTASSEGGVDDVLAVKPVFGTDYTYVINTADWSLGADGYYYYKTSVKPTSEENPELGKTTALLTDGQVLKAAPVEGYVLSMEIIANAIQATPAEAVNVWDNTLVDVTGSTDGNTLTITNKSQGG